MKLTKEEILFIDTYLKNSGVMYLDIRYEMMDHIASAVEQKMETDNDIFRYALKNYMLEHKNEFLQSNRKYMELAGRRAMIILLKSIIKPIFIGMFILIYIFFYGLTNWFSNFDYDSLFQIMSFVFIVPLCGIFLYKHFTKGEKFSVADKILGLYCILNYFPNMVFRIQDKIHNINWLFLYYSIILGFAVITFYTYIALVKSYKTRFEV
jgi:hypothetical protein